MDEYMDEYQDQHQRRLDEATSRRLARLADCPVDTARLEQKLEPLWTEPARSTANPAWWRLRRPPYAAAAAVLLLVALGWFVFQTSTPAMADPGEMSQLHRHMLSSEIEVTPVRDIAAANRMIAAQWAEAPSLPEVSLPARACCLHHLGGRPVAAVQLEHPDGPVTMVVARANDLRLPPGRVVEHAGQRFTVHEHDGVTMVMTHDENRWLCVMGDLPEQDLVELAARVVY